MCIQVFEYYTACQHTNIIDNPCDEASDEPFRAMIQCKHYTCEKREQPSRKCGQGGYYCRSAPESEALDEVHKFYNHTVSLVSWLNNRRDASINHINQVYQALSQAGWSRASLLRNEEMLRAVQDHRCKILQLERAHYRLKQWHNKIAIARHHFLVLLPEALSQGLPLPSLVLPSDEPWISPPLAAKVVLPVTSAMDSTEQAQSRRSRLDLRPISSAITVDQDLGSLADSAWTENATLDSLPIGCWKGDRTSAISVLARNQTAKHRQQSDDALEWKRNNPEPPRKRKRSARDSVADEPETMANLDLATPNKKPSVTKTERRSKRSVKPINYSEEKAKSNGDSSDDRSTGSVYNNTANSDDSSGGSTRDVASKQSANTSLHELETTASQAPQFRTYMPSFEASQSYRSNPQASSMKFMPNSTSRPINVHNDSHIGQPTYMNKAIGQYPWHLYGPAAPPSVQTIPAMASQLSSADQLSMINSEAFDPRWSSMFAQQAPALTSSLAAENFNSSPLAHDGMSSIMDEFFNADLDISFPTSQDLAKSMPQKYSNPRSAGNGAGAQAQQMERIDSGFA